MFVVILTYVRPLVDVDEHVEALALISHGTSRMAPSSRLAPSVHGVADYQVVKFTVRTAIAGLETLQGT